MFSARRVEHELRGRARAGGLRGGGVQGQHALAPTVRVHEDAAVPGVVAAHGDPVRAAVAVHVPAERPVAELSEPGGAADHLASTRRRAVELRLAHGAGVGRRAEEARAIRVLAPHDVHATARIRRREPGDHRPLGADRMHRAPPTALEHTIHERPVGGPREQLLLGHAGAAVHHLPDGVDAAGTIGDDAWNPGVAVGLPFAQEGGVVPRAAVVGRRAVVDGLTLRLRIPVEPDGVERAVAVGDERRVRRLVERGDRHRLGGRGGGRGVDVAGGRVVSGVGARRAAEWGEGEGEKDGGAQGDVAPARSAGGGPAGVTSGHAGKGGVVTRSARAGERGRDEEAQTSGAFPADARLHRPGRRAGSRPLSARRSAGATSRSTAP